MNLLRAWINALAALAIVALGGCATQTYAPENAPEMAVIKDFAPFYSLGPMQGRGPDATLRVGERVKLLRKEMGYSYVQIDETRSGYVANEDLVPAPPRPPSVASTSSEQSAPSGRRQGGGERYRGPQVNDSPLPESSPPPALDLNIGPEDIAPAPPPPDLDPESSPQFRY